MRLALPPFCCLCCTISRMVLTDSCLAESMKLHVLMTMISASSARGVSSAPLWWSMPIMTSESTRFLGQPSETKPTFGRVLAGVSTFTSSRMAGGVTDSYSINFLEKLGPATHKPLQFKLSRDWLGRLHLIFGRVSLRLAV